MFFKCILMDPVSCNLLHEKDYSCLVYINLTVCHFIQTSLVKCTYVCGHNGESVAVGRRSW